MNRRPLLDLIAAYATRHPDEGPIVEDFRSFVGGHPDCLERTCVPGHITGAAWIVDVATGDFLLTHHRKLGRWLQVGGHADGEPDLQAVALREAREESGLRELHLVDREPLDLDVHEIPARGIEPAHLHYDVRFLLLAAPGQRPAVSAESFDVRWFPRDSLESVVDEPSILRMARKVPAGGPALP